MKLFGNMNVDENVLSISGVRATELAEKYSTPLYVFDENLIRQNCREYYNGFNCENRNNRVAYAGKAFLTLAMCRIIQDENLYLDVVSGGELFTAYKSGFPLEKVYFHGNNKTIDEIELGIDLGVGTFVADNEMEIELIDNIARKHNKKQKIYLRITPGIEAHTHEYIKTGQLDSKFGFAYIGDNILNVVNKVLSLQNVELSGLHCHIGSQIFDIAPYEDATEIMLTIIKDIYDATGYLIKELDLGGGFGIYYTSDDEPKPASEYCAAILSKADQVCETLGINMPILTIEPGRSIVGNAGITLYKVGSIKEVPSIRKYISVDGGMTDNIRPALYNAEYESIVANKVNSDELEDVTVAGKCCESGDILINSIRLPKIETGDLLAIMSTGAYGYSMANNYNKVPKAAVVMIKDGEDRLVCKRETYADIIRNEI
ncbi:diaminopimelate decarboxylase [Clostridium sp. YIM B02505]|uniref:Diaminopimelate decarboxylase n=1 Tax=Clostridium yunnanense TaxID=2800325 RepID=A0ABS1EUP9_9CLOT|nr:diaminopimelate decarboxylase [Clostridium yunnanense]MBK1813094.1 diaminopimelate decarboxylase [Clostridium yunnanense]